MFAVCKVIVGNEKAPAELRQMVRDSMATATGDNAPWALEWLKGQLANPDHTWAGGAARALAGTGSAEGYAALLAEVGKRTDADDFLYYGLWALSDFFRRSDLAIDKKAGIALATKLAQNAALRTTSRSGALEAVFYANVPAFPKLAAKLARDKDKGVADKAAALLKRFEEQKAAASK